MGSSQAWQHPRHGHVIYGPVWEGRADDHSDSTPAVLSATHHDVDNILRPHVIYSSKTRSHCGAEQSVTGNRLVELVVDMADDGESGENILYVVSIAILVKFMTRKCVGMFKCGTHMQTFSAVFYSVTLLSQCFFFGQCLNSYNTNNKIKWNSSNNNNNNKSSENCWPRVKSSYIIQLALSLTLVCFIRPCRLDYCWEAILIHGDSQATSHR